MGDLAYTTVPGKIPNLFEKIKQTGVPSKVTVKWLQSIGFNSSNDRTLLPILRFVGFCDSSDVPTDLWKDYRGQDGKRILAKAIRNSYSELYSTYPDAHARSREDLQSFFSTHSSAGSQATSKMVSTFQELCKIADSSAVNLQEDGAVEGETDSEARGLGSGRTEAKSLKGLAVNINIQLTLPGTTDEKVYEALFASMKKHLLTGEI